MKYLKEFASVSDANTQGAAGLSAPHVSIINGKSVVNIYNADGASAFTCTFNDDGTLVPPTPVYSGWGIESGATVCPSSERSHHVIYGNSNWGGIADMDDAWNVVNYTESSITITGLFSSEPRILPIWDKNSKYILTIYMMEEGWVTLLYSISDNKLYASLVSFPDITRSEEYNDKLSTLTTASTFFAIAEATSLLEIEVKSAEDVTINAVQLPSEEEMAVVLARIKTTALANGETSANIKIVEDYVNSLYDGTAYEAEQYLVCMFGKLKFNIKGTDYTFCIPMWGY